MELDQLYQQYSSSELIQTVGQLYMDLSRSQIVIRQLQQMIKDRDTIITDMNTSTINTFDKNDCGPED